MASTSDALDPDRLEPDLLGELRAALREAAFDDQFLGRCEAIAPRMLDAVRLPAVHWWLRQQPGAAAVLARLWAYGDTVTAEALAAALDDGLLAALDRVGAVHRTPDGVRGGLRLVPFAGLWIASDEMHAEDPVMGPGATTQELARAIPPDAGRVLDVGCGAGSLALVAASRGAAEVVGVDLHPRAAGWSRVNAALNELTLELHTGDLTAPVAGRRFDLVVAQPPFVVQPAAIQATTYLHGGAMGDELTMRMLGELPAILAEDGEARVLFDSPVRPNTPLWQRLKRAYGSHPEIQQLVFVAPGNAPDLQAIGYAASSHPALGPAYAQAVHGYREHLHRQGIEQCEHALAVLRRIPGGPPLSVTLDRTTLAGLDAEAIEQTWAGLAVASRSEADLLETTVALPPGARLVQRQSVEHDEASLSLVLPAGRGGQEALSDAAALLIDLLRQPGTVAAIIERYASAAELEPAEVRTGVVDFVRQSLVSGRLVAQPLSP